MSRGRGRIERAIEAAFAAEPDNAFTVEDLCYRVYPEIARDFALPDKRHRVAVIRAARKVAILHGNIAVMEADTRGSTLTFYNPYNVMSYAMARLKADNIGGTYRPGRYNDEPYLRKELAPGGFYHEHVQPGAAWWRHTEQRIAERDGNTERAAQLQAEGEAASAEITAGLPNIRL